MAYNPIPYYPYYTALSPMYPVSPSYSPYRKLTDWSDVPIQHIPSYPYQPDVPPRPYYNPYVYIGEPLTEKDYAYAKSDEYKAIIAKEVTRTENEINQDPMGDILPPGYRPPGYRPLGYWPPGYRPPGRFFVYFHVTPVPTLSFYFPLKS